MVDMITGVASRLYLPTTKGLRFSGIDSLHRAYLQNLNVLLDYHMSVDVPFFALHRTYKKGLEGLLAQKRGNVNVATFYDKPRSRERLFQLLVMCTYVAGYTVKRDDPFPGGVMVFDVEKNGENLTDSWEHLAPAFDGATIHLEGDSPEYMGILESIRIKGGMQLHRSDISLVPQREAEGLILDFGKRYAGVIRLVEDRKDYVSPFDNKDFSVFARAVLRGRFAAQKVLAETYDLLAVKK